MSDQSDSSRHIAGDESRANILYVDIDNQMESQKKVKQQRNVKQKCQWWGVYVLGLSLVITAEVIILLSSYYSWVLWPALSYAVVLVILGALGVVREYCPGRKKPYSTLVIGLYMAALAALIGGVLGAYYFKDVWYFDKGNKYTNVMSDVNPSTFTSPTFLSFAPGSEAALRVSVALTKGSTTYCLAPIIAPSSLSEYAFYWAVDTNCCSGNGPALINNTCRYFGKRPADELLSGEVYASPVPSVYKEATDNALDYYGFQTPDSALFVTLVSEYDHDLLMRLHRTQAYMCVTVVALAWPILGLFYQLLEWTYLRKTVS